MPSSLEKLASYLQDYKIVNKEFNDLSREQVELLTRKGVLPYEYISSWDKLEECELPEKENFFSVLNDSHISDHDYKHAQNVWNTFNLQTLGDYSDLYMKTDVLLLADVFENFRDQSIKVYGLDPAHYYTTPGFSWDAMLKLTGIQLKLLTDIDMVLFVERGIRGGLSQCSNRYATANHKYMCENYNKDEKNQYLIYLDANNLYGHSLSQYLPYDEFEWLENYENFDLFSIATDASHGYILEVDLDYPSELHNAHNDLPFCPEYAKPPGSKQEKLLAALHPKRNYVIHYVALKQALSNGLQLRKIHRVLKFKQSPWLKSYIDLNSSLRALAKNEFEKNFFKLMNNAVFGKTMENVRKRVLVKLMSKYDGRYGVEAQISKPNFHSSAIFNENLVAIQMNKTDICIDKPIYVGLTVLDLSKTHMYDFHYNYMQKVYKNNLKLLYTDTDSLIYAIQCNDFYEDMKRNIHMFDTSDYPADNIFNMPRVNKKIVGLMKDECNGEILTEFVGLRSKMYSTRVNNQDSMKKIKGIKASVVKKTIEFNDYLDCLKNSCIQSREQYAIRSKLHNVETIKQRKIALSPYDDKRFLQENSTDTLAWGHYNILQNGKKKCVRFEEEPTIHLMYTWKFAHHEARCGKWEEAARDRERFRRRIAQTNEIIMPVLVKKLKEM
ncbi:uncharacterized protein LOC103317258 isoform X1 [Nasonia vitripennis]|uniref:DNA-directed DNA polymerase n=1 Tax=Nasonia vitripennis TaxID=7425 RepID=A0A7M7QBD3_NASVI|nr:uncharacterized protein LOC103317258 isoform X1 [Nasonia vitripennis]